MSIIRSLSLNLNLLETYKLLLSNYTTTLHSYLFCFFVYLTFFIFFSFFLLFLLFLPSGFCIN